MAQVGSLVSRDYPFLSIRARARSHEFAGTALLDTGFTGHLALPRNQLNGVLGAPDGLLDWELADGTIVNAPFYYGTVEIVGLTAVQAILIFLGDDFILGRGVIDRFKVTFDHGQTVTIER